MQSYEPIGEPIEMMVKIDALEPSTPSPLTPSPRSVAARIARFRAVLVAAGAGEDDVIDEKPDADALLAEKNAASVHSSRVSRIRNLTSAVLASKSASGQERARQCALSDVSRRHQLEGIYANDLGELQSFRPATASLSEARLESLHELVKQIVRVNRIQFFEMCGKEENLALILAIMVATIDECPRADLVALQHKVLLKSSQLNACGRAELVATKRGRRALLVECKSADFDKVFAQMTIDTEAMLLERLEDQPDSNDSVFGVVSNFLHWHFMHLTRHKASFFQVHIDPTNMREGLRRVSGALLSILNGLPIEAVDEHSLASS